MKQNASIKITTTIIALITSLLLFATSTSAVAMTDMNGNASNIQSMVGKGKWTVAKIWKSDCHVCHNTIRLINQFQQQFPEANVLGISLDGQRGKQNAAKFIRQFNVTFPNLLSDDREMDNYLYAAASETLVGTPTIIVFNPQGKIAAVQPGAVTPADLIRFIRTKQAEGTSN